MHVEVMRLGIKDTRANLGYNLYGRDDSRDRCQTSQGKHVCLLPGRTSLGVATIAPLLRGAGLLDPVVCCSARVTGLWPLLPGFTASESVASSRDVPDVVGEDVAAIVLLLSHVLPGAEHH
ncbi:uncharacterized protein LOC124694756 isoform X1 [Lolium rigidum]|uniref:uncharacterized protein LOC124694756 isoform X1 n=1 Tax=Lolium rigidum TaxID=89674 RepID=UPI001F5D7937|nr:uncharacterized protein LOC124694756 isoform X1 [Lolium rigidum]